MSNAKQCDKCGKFYRENFVKYREKVIGCCELRTPNNILIRNWDLCDGCATELLNLFGLKPDPVQKTYENRDDIRWKFILQVMMEIGDNSGRAGEYINRWYRNELSPDEKGFLIHIFGEDNKWKVVGEDGEIVSKDMED